MIYLVIYMAVRVMIYGAMSLNETELCMNCVYCP